MDPIIVHLVVSRLLRNPVMPRSDLIQYFTSDMRYDGEDARDIVDVLVRGGYLQESFGNGTSMLRRGPKLAMVLPAHAGPT